MAKNWVVAEKKYDDVILQLLYNRGVINESSNGTETVRKFLSPDFDSGTNDPFLLPDMSKVVERIKVAKEKAEKIGIFADYDADGVPGAALLYRAFQKIGVKAEVYIPTREDGYGLSQAGIDYLIKRECALIISVDLGIRNVSEARYCSGGKVDLVITDHHLPGEDVPRAFAVINPRLRESAYPFPNLCGCGVAYKLVQALATALPQIDESFLKWNLDLVALSTIADMVPLVGENRIIAKFGLVVMGKSRNVGLRELIKVSDITPAKIDTYTVGFQIGPRINTPGRIDHAVRSFDLLTADDPQKAKIDAEFLNVKNSERQKMMDQVFDEALLQIDGQEPKDKIIIVRGKWERGVLGPPASRLVERFYRPAFVFADEGDELTGSVRSIEGVHILDLIEKVSPVVQKCGGHSGAAGLTVAKKDFRRFVDLITKAANRDIKDSYLVKKLSIDTELRSSDINKVTFCKIEELQPFGLGNSRPVFLLRDVELQDTRFVGASKKHLSLKVRKGSQKFKAIFFNFPGDHIEEGSHDVAFYLNLDTWNSRSEICLNILDMRKYDKEKQEGVCL